MRKTWDGGTSGSRRLESRTANDIQHIPCPTTHSDMLFLFIPSRLRLVLHIICYLHLHGKRLTIMSRCPRHFPLFSFRFGARASQRITYWPFWTISGSDLAACSGHFAWPKVIRGLERVLKSTSLFHHRVFDRVCFALHSPGRVDRSQAVGTSFLCCPNPFPT